MELLSSIGWTLGAGLFILSVCVVIEHVAAIERYSLASRIPGLLMNMTGTVLGVFLMWPLGKLWEATGIGPFVTIPLWDWLKPLGTTGYALQVLTIFVTADFLAYWRHRAEHSRFLWPVHKVHHSPHELHAANNLGHPLQSLFSWAFIGVPMSLIQIDGPAAPAIAGLTVAFLATYIHSPIDIHFGKLRLVLVDNRYHRIHHSLEPHHIDKNFGICFSLWDRLFGTAVDPKPGEWPAVGVAGVTPPRTIREFLLLPFRDPRLVEDFPVSIEGELRPESH